MQSGLRRWYSTKAGVNYYSLFPKSFPKGEPPNSSFKVDPRSLRNEFLQLQRDTHPDKAATGPEILRKDFERKSSLINEGYKTLINPLSRGEHLLKLKGIDALAEKDSFHDNELLMDIMVVREVIADATSNEELNQLKRENDDRIAQCELNLEAAFQDSDLDTAKTEVIKLSYWQSIKNQIDQEQEKIINQS